MAEVSHHLFYALQWRRTDGVRMLNHFSGSGRPQPLDRLHLTLAITPRFPTKPVELAQAMRNAGDAVAAAPFVLTLDTLTCHERHVALRPSRKNVDLAALYRRLVGGMAQHGIPLLPGKPFNPHVSLSYDNQDGEVRRKITPMRLMVEEFVLIHSEVGLARHHVLGRWRLAGEPGADLFGLVA